MAKFRKKKNKNGSLKCFQSEATFDGKTVTISFAASEYKEHQARQRHDLIAELERVNKIGRDPNPETLDLIAAFPELQTKLKDKGVLKCAATVTLGELCKEYVQRSEKQKDAAGTIYNKRTRVNKILEYFDKSTPINAITKDDASKYNAHLQGLVNANQLAAATKSDYIKKIRAVFKIALNKGLISVNPFEEIKAGKQTNEERQFYISMEETARIIEACKHSPYGTERAVLVALNRYQGMRTPSEPYALRWEDVDFIGDRIRPEGVPVPAIAFYSKKTKRCRQMPLHPLASELLKQLKEEQERDGTFRDSPYVLRHIRMTGNPRTTLKKILFRAGVEDYPKLSQNMRYSRSIEVALLYGVGCESKWIGHNPDVRKLHYNGILPSQLKAAASETWHQAAKEGLTWGTTKTDDNPFNSSLASWEEEYL